MRKINTGLVVAPAAKQVPWTLPIQLYLGANFEVSRHLIYVSYIYVYVDA